MSRLIASSLSLHAVGPLDLTVEAGACVALWGPSGAGKSLLLRALADLEPHTGEVRLGEIEQAEVSGPAWRRSVGYLPAESGWWAPTVREHFPGSEDAPKLTALEQSLELPALGLPPQALAWEVERLSTGERQRLALLRLLAGEPEALLLDEPTANLDPDTTAQVEALIARYRQERGAPVLWVSHDPEQRARVASRELTIKEGRFA